MPSESVETPPDIPGPDPNPAAPKFDLPAGAWDCHLHLFGPQSRYPYVADRTYTPPDARFDDLSALHAALGIGRAVLIQPSVYGVDNRCLLEGLLRGGERYRGVVVVDPDIPDRDLDSLHTAGVRGVRLNLLFAGGGRGLDDLARLAPRLAARGWHAQLLIDVAERTLPWRTLSDQPCDIVFDHMGHMDAAHGLDDPGFQMMASMARDGRVWVKLSAAMRLSRYADPPYPDVVPIARALVQAAPTRVVWGSDWPHVMLPRGGMPNDGALLDLLADWVPDPVRRRRILVDNPNALYGGA